MILLFEFNLTSTVIGALITGLFAILAFIFKWIRFSPKDKVEVKKDDAMVQKLHAEAKQIEVQSDATVADLAMKIAKDLRTDNELTKKQLEIAETELNKTVDLCRALTVQLEEIQRELERERIKNTEMTKKISELVEQIGKLQKRGE